VLAKEDENKQKAPTFNRNIKTGGKAAPSS